MLRKYDVWHIAYTCMYLILIAGLKLVLTRLEWTLLYEEKDFDRRMTDLVLRMKKRIEQKTSERSVDTLSVKAKGNATFPNTYVQ